MSGKKKKSNIAKKYGKGQPSESTMKIAASFNRRNRIYGGGSASYKVDETGKKKTSTSSQATPYTSLPINVKGKEKEAPEGLMSAEESKRMSSQLDFYLKSNKERRQIIAKNKQARRADVRSANKEKRQERKAKRQAKASAKKQKKYYR